MIRWPSQLYSHYSSAPIKVFIYNSIKSIHRWNTPNKGLSPIGLKPFVWWWAGERDQPRKSQRHLDHVNGKLNYNDLGHQSTNKIDIHKSINPKMEISCNNIVNIVMFWMPFIVPLYLINKPDWHTLLCPNMIFPVFWILFHFNDPWKGSSLPYCPDRSLER